MPAVAESPRLKTLKTAPLDSWVILSRDETTILASGKSFEEISKKAEELGSDDELVILKTPKAWSSLSV